MSDQGVEDVLRRYRVAAPADALRARILAGPTVPASARLGALDYALCAAAAMLLTAWVGTGPAQLETRETSAEAARRVAVEQLTIELGGDEHARQLAELAVPAALPVAAVAMQEERW
jgi:hypothetical protein